MTAPVSLGPRVPMASLSSAKKAPAIERNELSVKAMGGTELMQHGLASHVDADLLSKFQIICSRVREIDPNRIPILWCHDLAEDPEMVRMKDASFRNQFARIVFVSHWQRDRYLKHFGIPAEKNQIVIPNAITPIVPKKNRVEGEKIRLIYHSTPHRGLELLVPVVDALWKVRQDFELDVYSSFKLYGWEQRDEQYKALFEACEQHPAISYHGTVSNSQIRDALSKSDIFAYPSIWQETSCICAIEAMSANNLVVCSSLGALPETTGGFALMYDHVDNRMDHANRFATILNTSMNMVQNKFEGLAIHLGMQKRWTDSKYGWDTGTINWTAMLEGVLASG